MSMQWHQHKEEENDLPLISEEYEGCICEIKSMKNDVLATGFISLVSGDEIEVTGMMGEKMPILPYNQQVKVSLFNDSLGFLILVGNVYISSDWLLKISEMTTLQKHERRAFFRINVENKGILFLLSGDEESVDDFDESNPMEVRIKDVSLGGCRIETDFPFCMGDAFIARFSLIQITHELRCVVCRIAGYSDEDPKKVWYGCSFEKNRDCQLDALCRDLFQVQRQEIQKRRKR